MSTTENQEALTAERTLPARTASAVPTRWLRRSSPDMRHLIETGGNHANIMFWRSAPMTACGEGGFIPDIAWSQWMPCARCGNHADAFNHAIAQLPAVRTLPLVKYIHCSLTGKVIASRLMGHGANEWGWIAEAVATWEGCLASDVDCIDIGDRMDCVTVKGHLVAYTEVN